MSVSIENVRKTWQGQAQTVTAVDGVSLSVGDGEFLGVQGPSGCGKSTLLLMAGGLLAPDSGTVKVQETNPYTLNSDERAQFRATTIGFVFQQFHLVPYLSVLDNVRAPSIATGAAGVDDRARELISKLGLESRIGHVPGELSSGERQRTALARALLNEPKLILADEPTGNLDQENAELVLSFLREFCEGGGAVMLVTHDTAAAEKADRVVNMRYGKLEGAEPESSHV